eukprot:CAMPEP_0113628226 /NCGR_PEP_ID=MMETSP0017_2-20120614/14624_1 /TAXON_ID=2856 /ORGANISM="Cylindrotheca closterium" /LENGTH=401 /DNA_ID=CAMNT_0000538521 /DNA_START=73 /DNA_END=1278 /DNA_ORIENTATION=- /assembly_acc=CAM_ASM_000147
MPSTRRSLGGGALQTVNANVPPPTTPGTKVRKMQAELDKKDSENEALRASIQNLTSVLGKLDLVKTADPVVNPAEVKNKKKDPKAPVPAKTAYKFFCDVTPAQDNMQQLWKETDAKKREPFVLLAAADKERYQTELAAYNEEKKALEMYYDKKKQEQAMAFFEAHLEAQAALKEVEAGKDNKKANKDPDAPKRPTSSYMYFAKETRAEVVAKHPDAKPTEVTTIMGAMWKQLNAKSMKKFEKMAEADRVRYAGEKAIYDAKVAAKKAEAEKEEIARFEQEKKEAMELLESTKQLSVEMTFQNVGGEDMSVVSDLSAKSKKKKDPNAPKRALTAYNFFFTDNRESIKSKMPVETTNTELMSEIGRQWKALAESKKKKYNKMAEKDKVRYANEMAKYNANKPE